MSIRFSMQKYADITTNARGRGNLTRCTSSFVKYDINMDIIVYLYCIRVYYNIASV